VDLRLAVGAVALLFVGCDGGDDPIADAGHASLRDAGPPPAGDVYAAGMEHVGEAGRLKMALLEAEPAPPDRGDNRWTVRVLDADDVPQGGCALEVKPFMPAHGHGANKDAVVTPAAEPGEYVVEPLDLFMPGLWEVRFTVECGGVTDNVLFSFWIRG